MSSPRPAARARSRGPALSLLLGPVLALTLALGACSGDDDGDSPSSPGAGGSGGTTAADEPAVRTVVTLSSLTGKLGDGRKERVKRRVATVIDGWIDAAYVGGDYPRSDFADSFPGFSVGAAADATADIALTTNQRIGERIDGVTATKRRLRLDVLAVDGKAVGVTARVTLDFDTTGDVQRSERVKGQLFLTYQGGDDAAPQGGWQVFGYDLTKGVAR